MMSDFTSNFWGYFILITTVASIAALFVLIGKFKGGKKVVPGESKSTTDHIWDEDLREYNNPLPAWWLNMFYISLVFGIIYLILYPGLGAFSGIKHWTQVGQYNREIDDASKQYDPIYNKYAGQDLMTVVNDPAALQIGKRLFSTYCTPCHGSDAGGARGFPNLRDSDWLYGGAPDTIQKTIMEGRNGMMPAWKGLIKDKDIDDVADYVISLSRPVSKENEEEEGEEEKEGKSSNIENGKKTFGLYCAACHGQDGKGNQQIGAPNLTDDIWLHGGSRQRIIETITQGRQSHMPPHKEFLGEARVHLLAAYVYSLSTQK